MRRKRFSREQILEADLRDILDVAKELNLPLERKRNTYKVSGYGGLYITPEKMLSIVFLQILEMQTIMVVVRYS